MSNEPTDGAIRAAFLDLRDAQLPRVTPPGVAAAHRTVRRRRSAAGATAALTALAMIGVGYLAGSGAGPGPGDGPRVGSGAAAGLADSATAGPDRSADSPTDATPDTDPDTPDTTPKTVPDADLPELRRLSELATAALEEAAVTHEVFAFGFVDRTGADLTGPRWTESDRGNPMLASSNGEPGDYRLRVSCGGTGSLAVTVRIGEAEATVPVRCASTATGIAAEVGEASLVARTGGAMEVAVEPDRADWGPGARVIALALIPQR